jgi:fucose 4-O-acetylase-like acetyltransferase
VEPGRLHAIDHLKASAIVSVVFAHSGRDVWTGPERGWDYVVCVLRVRFHVPTFLFVSG